MFSGGEDFAQQQNSSLSVNGEPSYTLVNGTSCSEADLSARSWSHHASHADTSRSENHGYLDSHSAVDLNCYHSSVGPATNDAMPSPASALDTSFPAHLPPGGVYHYGVQGHVDDNSDIHQQHFFGQFPSVDGASSAVAPMRRRVSPSERPQKSTSVARSKVAGLSRPRKSGPPAPLSLVNMSTFTSPLTPHSAQPTSGKTAKEAANLEKLQKEYGRLATNVKLNQEVILQLRKMIGVEPSKDLWLIVFLLKAQHVLLPRAMSCQLCRKNGEICVVPADSRMKPGPKAGGGITCRCCTAAHVPCEWTGAPSLCTKDEKRRFRAKQVEVAGIVSRGLEVGIQDWVAVGGQGPVEGVPMLHVQDAKFIYDWLKSASSTLREIRTHVLLLIGFDMERLTAFSPAENDEKGGLETLDQKQPILASPSTSSENELSTPLRFDLIASTSPTYTMYGGRGSDHPSTQKSESPLQTPPIDDTLWLPYASGSSAPKDTSRYLKSHYGGEVSLPCGPVTPLRKQPAHVRGEGPSPWRSVVPPAL